MLSRLLLGILFAAAATAQTSSPQVEIANLREDVRGLTQRLGDLTLRVEQLEQENATLRTKAGAAEKNYATLRQLNDAVADLNRDFKAAVASAKTETLDEVGAQLTKLANQTNAALESLAKSQAARAPAPALAASTATFSEGTPKDGASYVVQKGDTIALIAKKTGAKQQDIITANKLTDPSHIVVGQALVIPVPTSNSTGK